MQQNAEEEDVFYDEEFIHIMQKVIGECDGFEELKKYIAINKPSFNLINTQFQKVLDQNNKEKFEFNLQKIFEELLKNNVQRVFIRVLFQYLKKNKDQMNLKQLSNSGIAKNWKNLQVQELQEFIELFELKAQITDENLFQHFQDFVNKKKFQDAFQFYQALQLPQKCFDTLIEQMGNNHDAGRAADFIMKLDYNPANYPKIVERLEKSCTRYLQSEYPWFKCEEMLMFSKSLLVYYCEDAYFHGKKNEALSIIKRNNLINEIKKPNLKEEMEKDLKGQFEEIPNVLFLKDEFKPAEEFISDEIGVYLHCKDFGYPENHIVIVDKIDQNYLDAWKCINQSNAVGYDCEHITPWTKLDYQGFKVCLVQIATSNHVFLFDYQKLKEFQEFKNDVSQLLENVEILKIGLSLKDDLKHTVNYLKLNNIIIRSIIELSTCFKVLEGDPKLRSLAYISEFYFKKKLSKYDTCSNWEYRPLRKAQIHYAALDAIASLQVFQTMKEKNNQIIEQEKDVLSIG
ncbi:unnamed protein product (macronuclear) [Paramecium tetraurelia]|uniref:3'-5' exonuclease domain-containing protein n=1 Tax=Paramecium tetraurelia TaxID=5888 RepID=A0D7V1_PARTE|nr:uncharacterized protein GSPATT00014085001 [Paramecium tetraurelia]CAK79118.1 unnamed protein product [Paramecium tetraurelia]|eukprot:XP_001446515.1 hypothetical protein (macronuclear) [Paramecium tetraurelia strain d4-2]